MVAQATTLAQVGNPARFPRPVLWGAGGLIGLSILLAAFGRFSGETDIPRGGVVVVARDLRFADQPNGDVAVFDAGNGRVVHVVTGQAGFLRGTMRGLASARRRAGSDDTVPFRLTAWRDGRLTLDDPENGRHVELEAFGPTNEAAFAVLLQPEGAAQ